MLFDLRLAAFAALTALPSVFAQTSTDCNPMLRDDCPVETALGTTASFNWTQTHADSKVWNTTLGTVSYTDHGADFTVAHKGDAPTIQSEFYIFWGRVSVIMKAAPGQGIVSSVVLESSDLDEIDWEWIGGNTSFVQTNFFGKGDTTTYDRSAWHPVDNTLNAHNYTVVWTQQKIDWYVDGNSIRSLAFDDPLAMSKNKTLNPQPGDRYPQTPMNVRIGPWAGGEPSLNSPDTVDWAGGKVDYNKGPFTQTVLAMEIEDFTKGSTYTYGDKTGSWQSIKVATGNSTVADYMSRPQGVNGHWNALPKAARYGIIIGAISVVAILMIILTFCCIKHRRAGRKEKAMADAEWDKQLNELQQYKRMMVAEEEIHPRAGYI